MTRVTTLIDMTTLLGTFGVGEIARRAGLRGAASAMDLRGNTLRQYRMYRHGPQADTDALRNDWRALSAYLAEAARKFTAEK